MRAARFAWAPCALTLALVVVSLVLPPNAEGAGSLNLLLTSQALTFAAVGLVLARAQPRNSISWLFSTVGVFVALYLATERYQHYALVVRPGELPLGELSAWLQAWLYVPALGIFVTLLPQLFPTGRPISRRWYPALGLAGLAFVGMVLQDALAPGRIDQSTIVNPVGITPSRHDILAETAFTAYALAALVGFAAIIVRWRRSDVAQRQQIKVFAYFASLIPVFVIVSAVTESFRSDERVASVVLFVVVVGAFLGLPIATAIAILRYRLYDIDLVINRTLVYGALTVLLASSYLGLVLLLQLLLSPVTSESDLAVAVSTLAVAALFRPVRTRIQAVVDRRFYRRRFDAAHTLEAFGARLRDELDLGDAADDLRRVADHTMQPAHLSLWLRSSP